MIDPLLARLISIAIELLIWLVFCQVVSWIFDWLTSRTKEQKFSNKTRFVLNCVLFIIMKWLGLT